MENAVLSDNADAPETNKFEKLDILDIVVDVACKFEMFNAEYLDKPFNYLKVVVDVACSFEMFRLRWGQWGPTAPPSDLCDGDGLCKTMGNQLVEFQNGVQQLSRNLQESGLVMLSANPSILIFRLRGSNGLAGAAHTAGRDGVASDSKGVVLPG